MAYVNPFAGVRGLQVERIDQGVDFAGSGPVAAIGAGRVEKVLAPGTSGWPGLGGWVSYRLTEGPASGHVVYVAEDFVPSVSPGQTLTAGQIIGQMQSGSAGIETGWANENGSDTALAQSYGGYTEGDRTALGANFDKLLVTLGVPASPGISSPNRGTLAPGFSDWSGNIPGVPGQQGSIIPASNVFSPSDWASAIAESLGVPDIKDALQRLGLVLLGGALIFMGLMMNAFHAQEKSVKIATGIGKAVVGVKGSGLTKAAKGVK